MAFSVSSFLSAPILLLLDTTTFCGESALELRGVVQEIILLGVALILLLLVVEQWLVSFCRELVGVDELGIFLLKVDEGVVAVGDWQIELMIFWFLS